MTSLGSSDGGARIDLIGMGMFGIGTLFPMVSRDFAALFDKVGLCNFAKRSDADRPETSVANDRAHGARIGVACLFY
jgi:hypothetical protein